MQVSNLTKTQVLKVAKTLLYLGISAAIGGAIAIAQDQPELLGVYAPLVNVVLVTLKQFFTEDK